MSLISLLVGLCVVGLLMAVIYRFGVFPTLTAPRIRKLVLAMLPPKAKCIGELGSGWGGMSKAFSEARPEAQVTAFESSILPHWFGLSRARGKNITAVYEDFFSADLSKFDVLYCYLSALQMKRLKPLIAAGTTVISNGAPMPGWQPAETQTIGRHPAIIVFRYIAP